MPEIVVSAQSRSEKGKNVNRRLRAQGLIPGVLYGAKKDAVPVAVSPKEIGSILLHADFYEVALDQTLEVDIHVEIRGVPVGVKVQGGVLDIVTRELRVECLPTDIPDKIVVDVSELELGKHIRVSDLQVPDKVKVLTDRGVVVVHVVAPRAEEEVAPAAAEAAPVEGAVAAEPEVIKKGKAVAEGAEGEEKPEKPERAERAERAEKPEKKEKK
jgi:large subunit ribosomal protein L25